MKPDFILKYIDLFGITVLAIFLFLSYSIRVFPEVVMNPGFPILRAKSTESYAYMDGIPYRTTSLYKPERVTYENRFVVSDDSQIDTSFAIEHRVTRFEKSEEAMAALYTASENYNPDPVYKVIDIYFLDFASRADKYYLWCEQESTKVNPAYVEDFYIGERVFTCYYWSVYGRFYSELRMYMWSKVHGGRHFSLEIFSDFFKRADHKLSAAQRWFREE